MLKEILPKDLKAKLDAGEDIALIDVREDWEVRLGKIAQAEHIAMNEVPENMDKIPKDKPVVFICKSGRRSESVANYVQAQGYENVMNLVGGMMKWSQDVDPSIPTRY